MKIQHLAQLTCGKPGEKSSLLGKNPGLLGKKSERVANTDFFEFEAIRLKVCNVL